MPNVIAITDKIDHLQCLNNLGFGGVDTMTIGDPQNYVLSPCCIHGYRMIWSPRPTLHWFRPTLGDLTQGLRDGGPVFASKDSAGSAGGVGADKGPRGSAAIDTLGLGTWRTLETSGINSWHGRTNKIEDEWNWTQEKGAEGYGGDRPEWFTPGRTIKGAGGSGTSWVLIDGFTGGTNADDPPADIQSKWWGTTQTDLSTIEEELNAQDGYNYVAGQQVTVVGTTVGGNENSGLGVSSELGPEVGGSNPLWVQYGQRIYIGLTKCLDPSPHVHRSGKTNWGGVGHFDKDVFKDLTSGPSHSGGMTPEIVIYGGDVQGVRAIPNISASGDNKGDIESFTITDPGATVIGKDVVDMAAAQGTVGSEIVPPNIVLSTPSSYYSGFSATVDVSSIFAEMKGAHPEFFKTSDEVLQGLVDSYIDPIAQTFLVNENYSDGIFLNSVDVCFSDRPIWGEKTGVTLEIRPTVNGFPSAEHILMSRTIEDPVEVNIADGNESSAIRPWDNPNNQTVSGEILPSFNDVRAYTNFLLPYPLYLESGKEYCFVIRSNDSNYKVWISDARVPVVTSGMVGKYDTEGYEDIKPGTGRKQYGGSFFRSQNGRTWSPDQHLDIMFRLNKCVFPVNQTKTAILRAGEGESTEFVYDRLRVDVNSTLVPNESTTTLLGSLTTYTKESSGATSVDSGIMGRSAEASGPPVFEAARDLSERMTVLAGQDLSSGSFKESYDLTTTNRDVSPQIDTRNIFVTPLQNIIDDGSLSASDITIIDGGDSYDTPSRFTVAPFGGGEGSSNATFSILHLNNVIDSIVITDPGSGFHKGGSVPYRSVGPGTGAVFQINSEEGRDGGNSKARYVTKSIDLAPGMEARHLRAFMTAHKPEGASIYVYYKVLSAEDTEEMTDKKWKVMTQSSPDVDSFNILASNGKQFSEFEFNSDEIITYSADDESVAIPPTYDTFKTFVIKIVMFSGNTTRVPIIKKFRTIAVY